ncbi:hypothetical protein Tco_0248094 [Tanacetum coccineum]
MACAQTKGKDCLVLMAKVAGSLKEDLGEKLEVEVAMVEEEVGGVENKSSVGYKFMASGEECLDSFLGAAGGEVKGGGVDFGILVHIHHRIPDTMVDVNVNAPAEQAPAMAPATLTDDQIMPRSRCVPIGKSNCYLDVEKSQSNPIYKIDITQVDNKNPFSSPPTRDALINFVNELGYPKVVRTLSAVVTNDMFQPWRALTTIINLCLTGKTLAFERPRAPVLQILWGIVNRAYIDYAERMWEEFTQSIHSFVEDKKNLALHTQGKKKANPLVIPSCKGNQREVFGMPIPNDLITDDIRGEQYYNEYLEKVAKHQRYLPGEEVSDPDSAAPKPAKATKPKSTKQSKPLAPKAAPVTKPAAAEAPKPTASQPPKPTPAITN